MKKTSNHSKVVKSPANKVDWYQRYKNLNSWRERPVSKAFIDKISAELMEWSDEEDSFKIGQFLRERGMPRNAFDRLVAQHEKLAKAYEYALSSIGDRREIGALKRELSEKTVHFVQHHYCPIWKGAEKHHADLKKDEGGEGSKTLVIEVKEFSEPSNDQ